MRTDHGVRTAAYRALMGESAFARALGKSAAICVHVEFSGARDSRIEINANVARPYLGLHPTEHFGAIAVSRFLALRGLGVTVPWLRVPSALRPPFRVVYRMLSRQTAAWPAR